MSKLWPNFPACFLDLATKPGAPAKVPSKEDFQFLVDWTKDFYYFSQISSVTHTQLIRDCYFYNGHVANCLVAIVALDQ